MHPDYTLSYFPSLKPSHLIPGYHACFQQQAELQSNRSAKAAVATAASLTLGCWDTFGGCLFVCWPHSHGGTHICPACLPSCHCWVGGWGWVPLRAPRPLRDSATVSLPSALASNPHFLIRLPSMGFRNCPGPCSAGPAWLLFGSTLIFVLKQELGTHKAKQISGTVSVPVMLPLASWISG